MILCDRSCEERSGHRNLGNLYRKQGQYELAEALFQRAARIEEQALGPDHLEGSQFTSTPYLDLLKAHDVRISMDGRGRALDNIFTERLWRTIKYEEVSIKDYRSPREARRSLTEYLQFYNERRLHQSLEYRTPAELYFK